MSIQNTVMPVEVYGNKVKFMYFGDYYDHTTVIIKGVPSGEVIRKIENAGISAVEDVFYMYDCIEVSGLPQGTYEVYTTNADGSERSVSRKFTITHDTRPQLIRQAAESMDVWDNSYIQEMVEDMTESTDALSVMFEKYIAEEDDDNRQKLGLVIHTYVSLLNKRCEKCCFTPQEFKLSEGDHEFVMDGSAMKVLRYDEYRYKVEVFSRNPLQEVCKMHEQEESLYLYVEIDGDGLPVNFTISFRPEMEVMQYIKEATISRGEALQRVLERTIDYPRSYLEFSEEELEWVSIIDKLRVEIPLFHSPSMSYEHGIITVTPHDDDIDLLSYTYSNLHLAINELEYCLEDNHRRVKYQAKPFKIYNDGFGLGTEPYLYWIENDEGQILSDIKVLNLSINTEMGGVEYDKDNMDPINERLRRLEMYHYKKHLSPFIQNDVPENICEKIISSFAVCDLDGDTEPSNVAKNILEQNFTRSNIPVFASLSMAVMKDWVTYGRYKTSLIKDPFYYRSKMNTIVLPMGQDILYKIERYDFINGHQVTFVPALAQSTQEYRFQNAEWAYVSAINTKSMRVSGFAMLDFSKRGITADVYNFMLTNVEVGY